jgi:hypothetical protein
MKKQTALQWLIGYYYDNEGAIGIKQLEQAEQMDREQMIDFAIAYSAQDQYKTSAEDYYKENYGGQDENQS